MLIFPSLVARYREPHRRYHTLDHILYMLALYEGGEAFPALSERLREAVGYAIWYHDAIYDTMKSDNEEKSADLLRWDLAGYVDHTTINIASRLVLSTKTHVPAFVDECVLSDLDLAILGAPRSRYEQYVDQVRREWPQAPWQRWKEGRKVILQEFYDREAIFYYLTDREKQAKENLAWELAKLN